MTKSRNTPLLERPLSARSVMASLLLGMHPPRLSGARLVAWCALFDVSEGTARVALHRMAARGDLRARNGTYELAGPLAARQPAQDWSLAPNLRRWDGTWQLATVTATRRSVAQRSALRDAMRGLRLSELREGIWLRPDNLPPAGTPTEARAGADRQCTWFSSEPESDPIQLADGLFAPKTWARRAVHLQRELAAVTDRLRDGDDGLVADAFVAGAAALVHVRADPLLPDPLLPTSWPGDTLRDAYRDYRDAFAHATRAWFGRHDIAP